MCFLTHRGWVYHCHVVGVLTGGMKQYGQDLLAMSHINAKYIVGGESLSWPPMQWAKRALVCVTQVLPAHAHTPQCRQTKTKNETEITRFHSSPGTKTSNQVLPLYSFVPKQVKTLLYNVEKWNCFCIFVPCHFTHHLRSSPCCTLRHVLLITALASSYICLGLFLHRNEVMRGWADWESGSLVLPKNVTRLCLCPEQMGTFGVTRYKETLLWAGTWSALAKGKVSKVFYSFFTTIPARLMRNNNWHSFCVTEHFYTHLSKEIKCSSHVNIK